MTLLLYLVGVVVWAGLWWYVANGRWWVRAVGLLAVGLALTPWWS